MTIACYERRGFSSQDFARFHPGGRLGRRLLQVGKLMHRDAELPSVTAEAGMEEAVREMDRKKLGMTCIVDSDGRLAGILTDGDLRRRVMRESAPLQGSVTEAMISTPTTIGARRWRPRRSRSWKPRRSLLFRWLNRMDGSSASFRFTICGEPSCSDRSPVDEVCYSGGRRQRASGLGSEESL